MWLIFVYIIFLFELITLINEKFSSAKLFPVRRIESYSNSTMILRNTLGQYFSRINISNL